MVVLHLLVDTRDAMGANLVNTMCEGVASLVESITGGKVFLRILSNLTDRALARAQMVIPVNNLEGKGFSGARGARRHHPRERSRDGRSVPRRDAQQRHHERRRRGRARDRQRLARHRSRGARVCGARRPVHVADALVQERARRPRRRTRNADEGRHRRRLARNAIRRCASITACSARPTRANSRRSWRPSASRRISRRCARYRPTAFSRVT